MVFVVEQEYLEELRDFHKELKSIGDKDFGVPTQYGKNWLGNVCMNFGLDWEKYSCRGKLGSIAEIKSSQDGFYFYMTSEDAWKPKHQMWQKILEKWKNIQMFMSVEESGGEIYINTDTSLKYFKDKYLIDLNISDNAEKKLVCEGKEQDYIDFIENTSLSNYFKTIQEAKDFVEKLTQVKVKSKVGLKKALANFRNETNVGVYFHEFSTELK
jgi:hypothetical protein